MSGRSIGDIGRTLENTTPRTPLWAENKQTKKSFFSEFELLLIVSHFEPIRLLGVRHVIEKI